MEFNLDRAKSVISSVLDNAVAAGDRDTMAVNVERDGKAKWAIVASADCCPWCLMVSGHGYFYNSEQSARAQTFHDHCKCSFVIGWDDSDALSGYDPEGINDRISECADTLGVGFPDTHDPSNAVTAAVLAEMATRDPRWLRDGTIPEVEYETPEIEAEILKERKHEKKTAERLAENGVPAKFVADVKETMDESTGLVQPKGLPDLENGYEIKTLRDASTFNTIDGYLRNVSRKSGAVAVVFDNAENVGMTDDELTAAIMRSRRFRRGRVYIIGKDGEYRRIR